VDTNDTTDLDYSPMPLITRANAEDQRQFTQEFRVASAAGSPVRFADTATLRWQAGVSLFTQDYAQDAVNTFAPSSCHHSSRSPSISTRRWRRWRIRAWVRSARAR